MCACLCVRVLKSTRKTLCVKEHKDNIVCVGVCVRVRVRGVKRRTERVCARVHGYGTCACVFVSVCPHEPRPPTHLAEVLLPRGHQVAQGGGVAAQVQVDGVALCVCVGGGRGGGVMGRWRGAGRWGGGEGRVRRGSGAGEVGEVGRWGGEEVGRGGGGEGRRWGGEEVGRGGGGEGRTAG